MANTMASFVDALTSARKGGAKEPMPPKGKKKITAKKMAMKTKKRKY